MRLVRRAVNSLAVQGSQDSSNIAEFIRNLEKFLRIAITSIQSCFFLLMIFYQIILCKTSANVYGIYNKIKILLCRMNNWKGKLHETRRIKGKI